VSKHTPFGRDQRRKLRYLRNFLAGRLVHINLQLLYTCNFRCKICNFWQPPYGDTAKLSLEQVETISDKLAQIGPQILSIGGGEPLLHPDIVGVVRALARHHFPVMICNGWYVTPEMARNLWQAGIYEVSISVDYADAKKHDEQRGADGAYVRAIEALRVLNRERIHPRQRVHMISVILEDNLDEVEPLIRLCRDMGITYLVTLYSDGRGERSVRNIPGEVSRRLLALKRKYSEFVAVRGYLARFSEAIEHGGIGSCTAGKQLCNIDSQGQVGLCIDRITDPVGNILSDDVLELERRLLVASRTNTCQGCWTSCRGNIETLRGMRNVIGNAWDYHQMSKGLPIQPTSNEAGGSRSPPGDRSSLTPAS
jgi:MoaA/NifB/PqqE/SkfB family radical SAM enzyme